MEDRHIPFRSHLERMTITLLFVFDPYVIKWVNDNVRNNHNQRKDVFGRVLERVRIYNDQDEYTYLLDFLRTINLQRVTISVTMDEAQPHPEHLYMVIIKLYMGLAWRTLVLNHQVHLHNLDQI